MTAADTGPTPSGQRLATVFLIEDEPVTLAGQARLVEEVGCFDVVGVATTMVDGLAGVTRTRPHLVVIGGGVGDHAAAVAALSARSPGSRFLLVTSGDPDGSAPGDDMPGVTSITRRAAVAEFVAACVDVAGHDSSIPGIGADVATALSPLRDLTPQEHRILRMVHDGWTNQEIADRLGLTEKTVRNYVSTMLRKMSLRNRTQAAAFAARHEVYWRLPPVVTVPDGHPV